MRCCSKLRPSRLGPKCKVRSPRLHLAVWSLERLIPVVGVRRRGAEDTECTKDSF